MINPAERLESLPESPLAELPDIKHRCIALEAAPHRWREAMSRLANLIDPATRAV